MKKFFIPLAMLAMACTKEKMQAPKKCHEVIFWLDLYTDNHKLIRTDTSIYFPKVCDQALLDSYRKLGPAPILICTGPNYFRVVIK